MTRRHNQGALHVSAGPARHLPAAAPAPEPVLGPELWPQPTFDATFGLTLNSWTVDGGVADNNLDSTFMFATALDTLVAGDYVIAGEFVDPPSSPLDGQGQLAVQIGGTATPAIPAPAPGVFSVTRTVAAVSTQVIRMRDGQGAPIGLTSLSVKRIVG
jgi:hypothetical protein